MISTSVDPKEYFSGTELVNLSVCYYQYEIFIVQDITCKNMFMWLFSLLLSYHEEGNCCVVRNSVKHLLYTKVPSKFVSQ